MKASNCLALRRKIVTAVSLFSLFMGGTPICYGAIPLITDDTAPRAGERSR